VVDARGSAEHGWQRRLARRRFLWRNDIEPDADSNANANPNTNTDAHANTHPDTDAHVVHSAAFLGQRGQRQFRKRLVAVDLPGR